MQLRFGLIALSVLSFVGCSSMSVNNGSLDYKKTTTVEPLKYPEGSLVRPATPLYPAPIIDPLALEHAPKVENQKGNRFAAPRPLAPSATPLVAANQQSQISRPQPFADENQNPLLKIDGNSSTVWQYTLSALSSLNYPVIGQSKDRFEVTVKVNEHSYVLKLTPVNASSNTLTVFNIDNSLADKQDAADLLAQIYQNWPA